MNDEILCNARKLLIDYLSGKTLGYEPVHPWHRDWKRTVLHSFRVEEYAKQIVKLDKVETNEKDVHNIQLASILHDIGRYDNREQHAQVGMQIVKKWLDNDIAVGIDKSSKEEVLQMILNHTKKDGTEMHYKNAVLQDADALDEIGIMSVFMAGNQINREDPFYFNRLLERVKGYEISFCNKTYSKLNTKAGKQILKQKVRFIENVIKQLESEIIGTNVQDNQILEKIIN